MAAMGSRASIARPYVTMPNLYLAPSIRRLLSDGRARTMSAIVMHVSKLIPCERATWAYYARETAVRKYTKKKKPEAKPRPYRTVNNDLRTKVLLGRTYLVRRSMDCMLQSGSVRRTGHLWVGVEGKKIFEYGSNQSGIPGVCWHKHSGKWQVHCRGKWLGFFETIEMAAHAVQVHEAS